MKNRVITISREFGSGGRTIGRETARKLNIPCYDQELIQHLAAESGFTEEYVKEQGEYAPYSGWLNALTGRTNGLTNQDHLWVLQRRIILDLAEKGPCVILGRCADYILRDSADCLTAFIHADMARRARRIVEVYGQREEAPEKRLRDKDKRRASYYQFYTDTAWGDARNYHIALDSGVLGIQRCVDILAQLF
ncbi:cytidylate kinase-like family protein [Dysosmobacter sp.]|uniref:cytidylate kinase-like family protein n=1 Tax=Dysosmobacter sp. TaxID=2591382 RepID=UPI002A870E97|nr:cytidylate kinase-like family protein [Dysosmobacter sp.]MDY3985233.1 cytidylate kinase-like family protein [Dysosmobacter sp.]